MRIPFFSSSLVVAVLIACTSCDTMKTGLGKAWLDGLGRSQGSGLTTDTIIQGLKEALRVGTENAVNSTSSSGGYLNNSLIRIVMPEKLQRMASTLRDVGLGSQVDLFEQKMNQTAELAAKEAAPVLIDAISQMSFEDAKKIFNGGDTAATDYFRTKTSDVLKRKYLPIVSGQMQQLGVVNVYKDLEKKYNQIPFVPKTTISIEDYVTDKALSGLFTVLAQEEKKIRADPAARTTQLLRQVFGSGS